jgi:hypothetical protein
VKAAKRQFLVKVDGIDGYWAGKTGAEIKSDTNKVYDGGSLVPDVISAPAEVDDVVVTRPYDPDRDQAVINLLKRKVGQWTTTVSVTPTEADLTVSSTPGDTYPNALLISVNPPEADASSGDSAEIELTFAVGSVA